jgi:hypothetical protein
VSMRSELLVNLIEGTTHPASMHQRRKKHSQCCVSPAQPSPAQPSPVYTTMAALWTSRRSRQHWIVSPLFSMTPFDSSINFAFPSLDPWTENNLQGCWILTCPSRRVSGSLAWWDMHVEVECLLGAGNMKLNLVSTDGAVRVREVAIVGCCIVRWNDMEW